MDYLVKYEVTHATLSKSLVYAIERKKSNKNQRLSEEKYRYLFNKNPESIFIWDATRQHILDVNETAINRYGYCRDEFLKMNVESFLGENSDGATQQAPLSWLLESEKATTDYTCLQHKKMELFCTPVFHYIILTMIISMPYWQWGAMLLKSLCWKSSWPPNNKLSNRK